MRVLCLTNMYPSPTAPDYGSFVRDMCDALEQRGHDVQRTVIDSRASGVIATPKKYGQLGARGIAGARWADVIYSHYLFPTGAIAAAAGRISKRPWVITAHGGDVAQLHRWPLRWATGLGTAHAAAIIAVSHYVAARITQSGVRTPSLYVANMGVDVQRFLVRDKIEARQECGLSNYGPVIIAVGGLTERKNPLTLLLAFQRLRATYPDAHLVFVGDGPLAGALREGLQRMGLSHAVTLTGAIAHRDVAPWIAAADVLALVSQVEPLGIVALEALASGRPVVATDVGGAKEIVDATCGALTSPSDPIAIATALAHVLQRQISPEACRAVAQQSTLARQAQIVDEILTGAVTGNLPATYPS